MGRARHGNSLAVEVNRYLQAFMLEWLTTHPEETKASLARALGISGAHVTNITIHGRGAGPDVEEAVATFQKITVDKLRRRAREQFADVEGVRVQPEDRYANRAAALDFLQSETSGEARSRILSMELKSDVDPPRSWWVREIERAEQMVRMEQARPDLVAARDAAASAEGAALEAATRPKRKTKG